MTQDFCLLTNIHQYTKDSAIMVIYDTKVTNICQMYNLSFLFNVPLNFPFKNEYPSQCRCPVSPVSCHTNTGHQLATGHQLEFYLALPATSKTSSLIV